MSGWTTDFKQGDELKTVREDSSKPRHDDRGALQARVAALLPDPQTVDPNVREVLMVEDAAIRVAATNASGIFANTQAFAGSEKERREHAVRMQAVRPNVGVTTGTQKPSRAQAFNKLKTQLRAMPEEKRYEAADLAKEKWSPAQYELMDEAISDLLMEGQAQDFEGGPVPEEFEIDWSATEDTDE